MQEIYAKSNKISNVISSSLFILKDTFMSESKRTS